jgi:large subunit ribosomal protein L23
MRTAYDVILGPVITEKMAKVAEKANVIALRVRPDANKIEIQRAVEQIWKVDVASVRTMNCRGKLKRLGRFIGRRPSWKKAMVTLKEGQSIADFSA